MGLSIICYLTSLALPVLRFSPQDTLFVLAGEDYWQGILALLFGWFGFTEGIIPFIAWFANHAWVLGLIQVGRRKFKYGGYMALIALGLASTTF